MAGSTRRYPFSPYPDGWYFVSTSAALAPGDVKPLKVLGRDLVLFRTESGEAVVLDAHCPHMGAHVGHGGTVVGESIRCPFHEWRFGNDGKCVEVPYQTQGKLPPVGLGKWLVDERSGLILVWQSENGTKPGWRVLDVERFGEEGWLGYERRSWKIRMHVQELAENVPDSAHLRSVHKLPDIPEFESETDGPIFRQSLWSPDGQGGKVEFTRQRLCGLGFEIIESYVDPNMQICFVAAPTPIDEEYVEFNHLLLWKDTQHLGAIPTEVCDLLFSEVEADLPIWEHKAYAEKPHLVPGDGKIGKIRQWAKQFYPEYRKQHATS